MPWNITIREPGSALTHFIALLMAQIASVPLLIRAVGKSHAAVWAMAVFIFSMMLLYGASTAYHSVNLRGRALRIFRKIDHMMIFVLIAGTYTPVTLLVLPRTSGVPLFIAVWSVALGGMLLKMCWVTCPKWFSSIIYIALGWFCVPVIGELYRTLPAAAFLWLLAGGIVYTIGGVIYALKLPLFNARHKNFGSHEIFHLFVMGGSICHFIVMFVYVLG